MRLPSALLLAAMVCGCGPAQPPAPTVPSGADRLTLWPATFEQLPGWQQDAAAAALPALLKSCERFVRLPLDRSIGLDGLGGVAGDWYGPCSAAGKVAPGDHGAARSYFEQWFAPHQASNNGNPDGLFTGYFEPEIRGSKHRQGRFTVPIHGKPTDAVNIDLGRFRSEWQGEQLVGRLNGGRLDPYPSRADIEAGAVEGKAPVLLWTDDAVDLHIMHIQGSGRVRLDDGSVVRLGVAGSNGHKFVGVGRVLKEQGRLDDLSMPAIRAWLKAHPADAAAVLAKNPRYIFYAANAGEGPVGTEGVALTAERSLAVDQKFIPLGLPLWLDTVDPAGKPLRRVMVAQDTGSAIKGPVRGDFFWGFGEAAFDQAGRMKSRGHYYLLLPRQRSPRLAAAG
jgi:membrane-bound lytic murein transglycosylase A